MSRLNRADIEEAREAVMSFPMTFRARYRAMRVIYRVYRALPVDNGSLYQMEEKLLSTIQDMVEKGNDVNIATYVELCELLSSSDFFDSPFEINNIHECLWRIFTRIDVLDLGRAILPASESRILLTAVMELYHYSKPHHLENFLEEDLIRALVTKGACLAPWSYNRRIVHIAVHLRVKTLVKIVFDGMCRCFRPSGLRNRVVPLKCLAATALHGVPQESAPTIYFDRKPFAVSLAAFVDHHEELQRAREELKLELEMANYRCE